VSLLIPIALLVVGLGLLAIEVYLIPGFNVVGILGILLIVFAVGFSFTEAGLLGGIVSLGISMLATGGLFWLLAQSGAWQRFVLSANIKQDAVSVDMERDQRARYLGRTGMAVTPLRPSGVAEIEGERIEVSTEGEFIAAGSVIRVVAMDRRSFYVRLAESLPETQSSA
jgi:membrane-bound serine protease (ClpP class)